MKSKKQERKTLSAEAERSLSPAARHVSSVRRFHRLYWLLVAIMGMLCALAIVAAVVANVIVGICIAIAVATVYNRIKYRLLRRILHVACASATVGLCLTSADATEEDTLFVPDRLMGMRVTATGDAPFAKGKNANVTVLYLPCGLTAIGKDALSGLDALEVIRFAGSRNAWERIAGVSALAGVDVVCDVPYPDARTLLCDADPNGQAEDVA